MKCVETNDFIDDQSVKERELNHNMVHKKEFSRAQELDADENKKKPLDFFVPVQTGICLDELNRQKKNRSFFNFLKKLSQGLTWILSTCGITIIYNFIPKTHLAVLSLLSSNDIFFILFSTFVGLFCLVQFKIIWSRPIPSEDHYLVFICTILGDY